MKKRSVWDLRFFLFFSLFFFYIHGLRSLFYQVVIKEILWPRVVSDFDSDCDSVPLVVFFLFLLSIPLSPIPSLATRQTLCRSTFFGFFTPGVLSGLSWHHPCWLYFFFLPTAAILRLVAFPPWLSVSLVAEGVPVSPNTSIFGQSHSCVQLRKQTDHW